MKVKKFLSKVVLTGVLGLSLAVPTFAAANGTYEGALTRGTASYIEYDIQLYSGVEAYTNSTGNNTYKAKVTMDESSDSRATGIDVYTCDSTSKNQISKSRSISRGGEANLEDVINYPNQTIRATFIKKNFNGTIHIEGKFYGNGIW